MKVLLVTMSLGIGGAETHILELAKGLKNRNIEVIVASSGGEYTKNLEELNIKHYNVPLDNKKINNMLKSYKLLKNIIENENVDIVHAHARIPAFICGFLHKKMNFKFVTTAHGVFSTKFILKHLTNWGEKQLAVSEDIKKYLLDNYKNIKEENIVVTVNGIDTNKFTNNQDYSSLIKEFNINENAKKTVHISRLDSQTTLVAKQLIEIADSLYENNSNIQIIIVGGGEEFDKIKQLAQEKNNQIGEDVIIITGPRTDINKFTSMGDIFVGVSRVALEVMSAQKPIILAGNQGYIGIYDESKWNIAYSTNFCCRDTKDSTTEDLFNDINYLINLDNEKLQEMGKINRNVVEKNYSIDRMINDNIKVYESINKK